MARWRWAWVGLAVGLAALLYGRGLGVPFYMDDVRQVPWAYAQSWPDLWTHAHFFGTYRPLGYSLYKLFITLQGTFDPFPLKLLNWVLFILDGLLAGLAAAMWWRRHGAQQRIVTTAGTVFLLVYPFAYQSVPWPGCVFHLMLTACALGAALSYDRWRCGGGTGWAALMAVLIWLAPLSHELGFVLFPLLLLVELRGRGTGDYPNTPRQVIYGLVVLALGVAMLFFWRQGVPGVTQTQGFTLPAPENVFQNVSYLLQVVTYPTALLSGALAHRAGANDIFAVWAVGLPTLAALVWLGRRKGGVRWLTALAWPAVTALILVLFVRFDILLDAPRQFTLTAAGVALVWAGLFAGLAARLERETILYLLLAALAVPSMVPVVRNMDHLAMLGEVLEDVADAGREAEPPILFVNLPAWTAHDPPPYAIGHFGTMIFVISRSDEVIAVTSGQAIATHDVGFANLLQPVPYLFGVHHETDTPESFDWEGMAAAVRAAGDVYLARYTPERTYLLHAGRVGAGAPETAPIAVFDNGVHLLEAETLHAKGRPGVRLAWELPNPVPANLEIFVHLYDGGGNLVSQADGPFLMGLYPLWAAKAGEYVVDYRYFDAPPGWVGVGMYDPGTGARVPAVDAAGEPLGDGVQIGF